MSSVRYKFQSSLVYGTVHFDGSHLSVGELQRQIAIRKRINPEYYGLQISDAQTGEDYADDAFIPQGSSVIVRRTSLWSEASRPAVTSMSPSSEPAPVGSPAAVPSQSTQTVDPAVPLLPTSEEPLTSTFNMPSTSGNFTFATSAHAPVQPVCMVRPLQLIEQELRAAAAVPPPLIDLTSDEESSSEAEAELQTAMLLCPMCEEVPLEETTIMPRCGHRGCLRCPTVLIQVPAHTPLPAHRLQLVRCVHVGEQQPDMSNARPPSPEGPPIAVHQAGNRLVHFDEVPQALEEEVIPFEGSIPFQASGPPGPNALPVISDQPVPTQPCGPPGLNAAPFVRFQPEATQASAPPRPEAPGMPPSARPPSVPLPATEQRSERDLARERNNRQDPVTFRNSQHRHSPQRGRPTHSRSHPGRHSRSRPRSRSRYGSRSHRRYDGYRRSSPRRSPPSFRGADRARPHRSRSRTPPPRGSRSRSPAGGNPSSSRHYAPPRRERRGREDSPPSSSSRAGTSSEVLQTRTKKRKREGDREESDDAGEGTAPKRRHSRSPSQP